MTKAQPRPDRIALLLDVARGEVWQQRNGSSTTPGTLHDTEPMQTVTRAITAMHRAGWVHLVDRDYGARQWQLLDPGEQILDEHEPGWRTR